MSSFTTQLRWFCEAQTNAGEDNGYKYVSNIRGNNSIIAKAIPFVFDFTFPIYDESHRTELEYKIIRHFYTREIGYETFGLWQLKLEDKMNLIMPYYNKLYESADIEFNPLYDVDYTIEGNKNDSRNKVNTSNKTENDSKEAVGSKSESSNKTNVSTKNNTDSESRQNQISTTKNDNDIEVKNKKFGGSDSGTNSKTSTDSRNNVSSQVGQSERDATTDSWNLYSDTPQSGVEGLKTFNGDSSYANSVSNNAYLTNARRETEDVDENMHNSNVENNVEHGNGSESGTNNITYDYTTGENNIKSKNGNESKGENETKTKTNNGNQVDVGSNNMRSEDNKQESASRNSNATNVGNENGREDYNRRVYGKKGSYTYSKMIEEYRKTILNIDMMIIKELEPLFMGLWE